MAPRQPRRFEFRFDWRYRLLGLPLGITPGRTYVSVEPHGGEPILRARFGFWEVCTPVANVVTATPTGPYAFPKTIGPPRLSLRDHGLTFATSNHSGLCIMFAEPVLGVDPLGLLRHPALTVTVVDVAGLAGVLLGRQ
jgi:hypothetical protein